MAHVNFPSSVSSEQPDVFIFPAVCYVLSQEGEVVRVAASSCAQLRVKVRFLCLLGSSPQLVYWMSSVSHEEAHDWCDHELCLLEHVPKVEVRKGAMFL